MAGVVNFVENGGENESWYHHENNSGGNYNGDLSVYYLTSSIDMYTLSIILAFGVPANITAVLIFATKSFRQASCGLYLIGKSISDTVFLLCTFVVWLDNVQVFILHTQGICQIVLYLTYISAFISVWFVVALTTENLVRIRYPFKVSTYCTVQVAKRCIGLTVVTAFALYGPVLWLNRVQPFDGTLYCQRDPGHHVLHSVYTYLDTVVTLLLPSLTILVLLFLTFEAVWRSKARNRRMYNGLKVSISVVMQQQITRMLSAVSVSFILMALPSYIARVYFLVVLWIHVTVDLTPEQYMAQHLLQLLYYLTFSVSIITYTIFSQKFRRTLCVCLDLVKHSKNDQPRELNIQNTIEKSKENGSPRANPDRQ